MLAVEPTGFVEEVQTPQRPTGTRNRNVQHRSAAERKNCMVIQKAFLDNPWSGRDNGLTGFEHPSQPSITADVFGAPNRVALQVAGMQPGYLRAFYSQNGQQLEANE